MFCTSRISMCVCVCARARARTRVCLHTRVTVVLLTQRLKKYIKQWQIFQMNENYVQLATLFEKQVCLDGPT